MGSARQDLRARARTAVLESLRQLGGEAERPAIIEHASRAGAFTASELAQPGPPSKPGQTRVRYDLSWALSELKREGLVTNPRRSVWVLRESFPPPFVASFGPPAASAAAPPPEAPPAEKRSMLGRLLSR